MRDLANNIGMAGTIEPQVVAATVKGTAVDLHGFGSATLVISTGAVVGAGDYAAKLQESDTVVDGDFTDVAATDLLGTLPAPLTASTVVKQGYAGSKRYIRAVITKNSGTSIAAGAVIVKGHAASRPIA